MPTDPAHVTMCGKDASLLVYVDVIGWRASLLIPRHALTSWVKVQGMHCASWCASLRLPWPARLHLLLVLHRLVPGTLQLARHHRAARARDDVRADLCETPFRELRIALVQLVSHRELEHAVAEEFEPLVRRGPLQRPRRVRERCCGARRRQRGDQLPELAVAALDATDASRRSRQPGRQS